MNLVNIVVHPEFAIMSDDKKAVEDYTERICVLASTEECYVVSSEDRPYPEDDFRFSIKQRLSAYNLVGPDREFISNGFYHNGLYYHFGHVRHDYWEGLCKATAKASEIRIHGCFFGNMCTQNLALQLYGYLASQQHW